MRLSVSLRRSLYLDILSGFFQVDTQIFRARFDNLTDHALFDDGVAARPQAGA